MTEFWKGIWEIDAKHEENAKWLAEMEMDSPVVQSKIEITPADLEKQLRKTPRWKAPGPDGIQGFWIKKFTALHDRIRRQLQACIDTNTTPKSMTEGRTVLIMKDASKGPVPSNFRPITCLPIMYKILTGIVADKIYEHLDNNKYIPTEQKGCHRRTQGCKDHLLLDKSITENSHKRHKNLRMAWIDYQKAYDMVPHSWIKKSLELVGTNPIVSKWLENAMENWNTTLNIDGHEIGKVKIRRGIYQGDSLSPLLFVIALIPLTRILRQHKAGYKIDKKATVNHLLYMDDLKLYAKSDTQIQTLVNTVELFSRDIGMVFGLQKCGILKIDRGKIVEDFSIQNMGGSKIDSIGQGGYKYLGVIEKDQIQHENMKKEVKAEYIKRLRAVLKSPLNGMNTIKAINTYAIPTIRYTAGIVKWTENEIDALDRQTRKMMTQYRMHHPRADCDRIYVEREEGGRGLKGIRDTIKNEEARLKQSIRKRNDYLSQIVNSELYEGREDKIKEQEDNSKQERWRTKKMHGQYLRENMESMCKTTWRWMKDANLKKETEGFIVAAQDQALSTNATKYHVHKTNESPKCRLCKDKDETVNHIIGECRTLAEKAYKKRHDKVATTLHWEMCKTNGLEHEPKWYQHQPQKVVENEKVKILWDWNVQTDKVIEHRRPDIILVNKEEKTCQIIDVAIPVDHNIRKKTKEKVEKYQELRWEVKKLWEMNKVEVVPIIIGALGALPKDLEKWLRRCKMKTKPGQLQKTVLIETAHILRKTLDSDCWN
jgi:hypothetical protein